MQGDFEVLSNADLEELRGVVELDGNLNLAGPEVNDLSALSCLERVSGSLVLSVGGDDFTGLGAIRSVRALQLGPMYGPVSLLGLSNLETIEMQFRVEGHEMDEAQQPATTLTSLEGLDSLTAIGTVFELEAECSPLQDLHGLESVTTLGMLVIQGDLESGCQSRLRSTDGLSSVGGEHGTEILIQNTRTLERIEGFESLEVVEGNIEIGVQVLPEPPSDLPMPNLALTHVEFPALRESPVSFTALNVSYNPQLQFLSMPDLESANALVVVDNPQLPTCQATEIADQLTPESGVLIEGNLPDACGG